MRLRFCKLGKIRFTSHRDVARMFERAFRKAQFPVAYSEGFSPRPRIGFGLALSTGHESVAEYLDADMMGDPDPAALGAALSIALPDGIDIMAAGAVPTAADSLQQAVTSCTWRFLLPGVDAPDATATIDAALSARELVAARVRKGVASQDDIRPAIVAMRVDGPASELGRVVVEAELATQPRSLRPQELIEALWPGLEAECRVLRLNQWIDHAGARREPIPVDATAWKHVASFAGDAEGTMDVRSDRVEPRLTAAGAPLSG